MWPQWVHVLGLVALAFAKSKNLECEPAEYCQIDDTPECNLPECSCFEDSTDIDKYEDRPQIVYLTYDDAFTAYAEEHFYRGIFDTFKNPDGNPIRATHFVSAQYTDYTMVNKYWKKGHEIASHSISHRNSETYWKNLDVEGWSREAQGLREMVSNFAAIPIEDIQGFRAPFLMMGGDEMIESLQNDGFKYDCSWASQRYGYLQLDNGLFPYTLDYASYQDCEVGRCPECKHDGFWIQPMLDLEDEWIGANPNHPNNGIPCSMLDGCVIIDPAADETTVKNMLMKNFLRNRNGTRAPMGLYMHAAWFYGDTGVWHYKGYKDFLTEITDTSKYGDVWIVPVIEGLDYVANYNTWTNQDLLDNADQGPFSFPKFESRHQVNCQPLSPCRYEHVVNEDIPEPGQQRYMHICGRKATGQPQSCPPNYPWLGDPCGTGKPC